MCIYIYNYIYIYTSVVNDLRLYADGVYALLIRCLVRFARFDSGLLRAFVRSTEEAIIGSNGRPGF